jgi:hypothetical protein
VSADRIGSGGVRRRGLLGTILALPLAAKAIRAPAVHPDAAMIAMAAELKRLMRVSDRLFADTPPNPDDAFLDMVEANDRARFDLRARILAMPSTTVEGLRAKAFAFWSVYSS